MRRHRTAGGSRAGHQTHSVVRGVTQEKTGEVGQHGQCLRLLELAVAAGPPSPENPAVPVPAMLAIAPLAEDAHHAVLVRIGDDKPAVGQRGDGVR